MAEALAWMAWVEGWALMLLPQQVASKALDELLAD